MFLGKWDNEKGFAGIFLSLISDGPTDRSLKIGNDPIARLGDFSYQDISKLRNLEREHIAELS